MKHLEPLRERAASYEQFVHTFAQPMSQLPRESIVGNEFALQALWNEQAFEGVALALVDGTPVKVIEPGRWNHAVGPDFRDAILVIGGELRRGDIECHVSPSDWDAHGHRSDPEYGGLILHLTWYATPKAKTLSVHVPHLALEHLLPFYPVEIIEKNVKKKEFAGIEHPCLVRFRNEPLALNRMLAAAGYYRLLAKTNRFIENLQAENAMQIFYESLMSAMGYSRNAGSFRRLAREVTLTVLEPYPTKTRFAILARVAGLLKETHRELWDLWWQSGCLPPLQPYVWDYRGLRPQNHPFKRLAGGLGILHHLEQLMEVPLQELPEAISHAADFLRKEIGASTALVGKKRAASVTLNLFVPYRLALGLLSKNQLNALPGEDVSMPMRDTWLRLTGQSSGIPKDGLRQQGLLQIYTDFCHNQQIICETCPIANGI